MSGGSRNPRFYRQGVEDIDLWLERATERVPNDGKFYVLLGGDLKGKSGSRNRALALYRRLLDESGYKPAPSEPPSVRNETVETYLDDLEAYWGESHRHTRRGGKGRY
jgi:hypothetical protein